MTKKVIVWDEAQKILAGQTCKVSYRADVQLSWYRKEAEERIMIKNINKIIQTLSYRPMYQVRYHILDAQ